MEKDNEKTQFTEIACLKNGSSSSTSFGCERDFESWGTLTRQKLLEQAALEKYLIFELHWVGKHSDPPRKFYTQTDIMDCLSEGRKSCMLNRN